jgi:hypothetical protein
MSKETRLVPSQAPHALSHIDIASLAPVTLEELTTTVIAGLNIIAAIIPDLRVPHPATKKKVRGARTVPREAVISIIAMVEASLVLQGMQILNLARAREVVEHDHGFRVLDERIEMLRKQVRYTMEARWAEVTSEAMAAYHVAKRLAKDPRYAELAAHLDTIRRHLGRKNGTTAKKQKTAPTA